GPAMVEALQKAEAQSPEEEAALLEQLAKGNEPKANVSRAKRPSREALTPDIDMILTHKAGRLDLRLEGPGVTDDIVTRLRQAIDALK
ncbi:MAG: hypothetical protein AAFV38_15620, partial [Pseudomonadota bacterium]